MIINCFFRAEPCRLIGSPAAKLLYAAHIYFPMMTVGEAAKYLGVGRKIVYQMIEFDQIRAVRENRAVLVEKRSLDEFRSSGQLN